MHTVRTSLAFVALVIAGVVMPGVDRPYAADAIRIGGTGTATGMLREIGPKFTAEAGGTVAVVPSLGSSGAIRALMDGKLDIVIAGRPLKADESAAGLRQVTVLRVPFVIATSRSAPGGFKSADIAKIYSAANAVWPDGTPMRIILRPASDTDSDLLGDLFAGMRDALKDARRRSEVPTAATDQDNADMAERLVGSFTATTTTQIKTERRHLQAIALDGIEPSFANFESGAYPFAKKLYVLEKASTSPEAARFSKFLQSPAGRAALRDMDVLPESK